MHKIDTIGTAVAAPSPKPVGDTVGWFWEGNPALGQSATHVSADWLNSVQAELLAVIEAAGLTPTKGVNNQLLAALTGLTEDGVSVAPFAIANNGAGAITGLIFDSDDFKSAVVEFDLRRKTDVESAIFIGRLTAAFDGTAWLLLGPSGESHGDDPGVAFTIDATTGQISYSSSNMSGTGYDGVISMKVTRFPV